MSASGPVRDEEILVRYVLSASWLYKDGRAGSPLRSNAWMPHPTVELSVFRTEEWSEFEIVEQGERVAAEREAKHRQATLAQGREYPADKVTFRYQGRGEILAKEVRATGLDVISKEPPPRHADIVNWPPLTGNKKLDEAGQMMFAMKLGQHATFVPAV